MSPKSRIRTGWGTGDRSLGPQGEDRNCGVCGSSWSVPCVATGLFPHRAQQFPAQRRQQARAGVAGPRGRQRKHSRRTSKRGQAKLAGKRLQINWEAEIPRPQSWGQRTQFESSALGTGSVASWRRTPLSSGWGQGPCLQLAGQQAQQGKHG